MPASLQVSEQTDSSVPNLGPAQKPLAANASDNWTNAWRLLRLTTVGFITDIGSLHSAPSRSEGEPLPGVSTEQVSPRLSPELTDEPFSRRDPKEHLAMPSSPRLSWLTQPDQGFP